MTPLLSDVRENCVPCCVDIATMSVSISEAKASIEEAFLGEREICLVRKEREREHREFRVSPPYSRIILCVRASEAGF